MKNISLLRLAGASAMALGLTAAGPAPTGDHNMTPAPGWETAVPPPGSLASGFAVVNADGSLARGTAVSSSAAGTGSYDVIFAKSVKRCVYAATIGDSDSVTVAPAGFATVAGMAGDDMGVYVATFDSSGTQSSLGFHLIVRC